MKARVFGIAASACLIALILLCLAWELWLAPLRPGGSWLALKTLPLLLPLSGVLRAYTDTGLSAQLAFIETALALIFFAASIGYVRTTRLSM